MGLPGHRRALPADPDRDAQRHEAMLWALLAIIVGVIVANKAFSPQYMMWLAGPWRCCGPRAPGPVPAGPHGA